MRSCSDWNRVRLMGGQWCGFHSSASISSANTITLGIEENMRMTMANMFPVSPVIVPFPFSFSVPASLYFYYYYYYKPSRLTVRSPRSGSVPACCTLIGPAPSALSIGPAPTHDCVRGSDLPVSSSLLSRCFTFSIFGRVHKNSFNDPSPTPRWIVVS